MKNRNRKSNIVIIVLIVIIAGCGIMAAGNFLGWFQKDEPVQESGQVMSEISDVSEPSDSEEADQDSVESQLQSNETADTQSNVEVCTITITCSSVLKNMDKLSKGKEKCVPSNGTILATSSIEFEKGESVYDILKRSCTAAGIPMSARKSSLGIYVEGINGLFEFDCGKSSGWTYSVNGSKPGHSCGEHKVNDGDKIVWSYTCGN